MTLALGTLSVLLSREGHLNRQSSVPYFTWDEIVECRKTHKIIIGVGGGTRSRHAYSLGLELGLPTGVLAAMGLPRRCRTHI